MNLHQSSSYADAECVCVCVVWFEAEQILRNEYKRINIHEGVKLMG